jgi:hypothetical protein
MASEPDMTEFERQQQAQAGATAPRTPWPFPKVSASQAAAQEQPEEPVVAAKPTGSKTTSRKPRATRADGAQFKVACVLLTAGEEGLHHDTIAAQLDGVATKVLSNALFNMKSAGRVDRPNGTQRWRLTEAGREWATGGGNLDKQRGTARTLAVSTSNVHLVPVRPSFRCYIASDGCFAVEKAGHKIELTLEETRQMVRYLDMVGEQLIEAAAHHAGLSPTPGEQREQRH